MAVRIGIIKEEKTPPDTRVPLTPDQCRKLIDLYPGLSILIESSTNRCYSDSEYVDAGIEVTNDISNCQILLGVKEVPIDKLLPGKTFLFFSHTIKKQSYNRELLRAVLAKNIRLVDYECLTDNEGVRVIAFGRWAGIVGAHNGLMAYGYKTGKFTLQPAHSFDSLDKLLHSYKEIKLPPMRIVITGGGRVAMGSVEIMEALGIDRISPEDFIAGGHTKAAYVQLDVDRLYSRESDDGFVMQEFFDHPELYKGIFEPYWKTADLMINAIYWDPRAPAYFSRADMKSDEFSIKSIADITCDIEGSIPATLRSTTIHDPVFGYDPKEGKEVAPYQPHVIDIMAVDNLPNELPRNASTEFGEQLMEFVIPQLLNESSDMISNATIAYKGSLTSPYNYLSDYVMGD